MNKKMTHRQRASAENKLRSLSIMTNLGFGEVYDRLLSNIKHVDYGYTSKIICPKTGNEYHIINKRNKTLFTIKITTDYVNNISVTEELTRYIVHHKTKKSTMNVEHNRYIHCGKTFLGTVEGDNGDYRIALADAIVDKIYENELPANPLMWNEDHIKIIKS